MDSDHGRAHSSRGGRNAASHRAQCRCEKAGLWRWRQCNCARARCRRALRPNEVQESLAQERRAARANLPPTGNRGRASSCRCSPGNYERAVGPPRHTPSQPGGGAAGAGGHSLRFIAAHARRQHFNRAPQRGDIRAVIIICSIDTYYASRVSERRLRAIPFDG